jgi:tetratricopeptide (TPR) repeat protein
MFNWQIEYQLGRVYNRLHHHEVALKAYNQALECQHRKRVKRIILYAITYTYCQMGKFQEALDLNAEIIRLFPRAKGPRTTRSTILKHVDKDLLKSEPS